MLFYMIYIHEEIFPKGDNSVFLLISLIHTGPNYYPFEHNCMHISWCLELHVDLWGVYHWGRSPEDWEDVLVAFRVPLFCVAWASLTAAANFLRTQRANHSRVNANSNPELIFLTHQRWKPSGHKSQTKPEFKSKGSIGCAVMLFNSC